MNIEVTKAEAKKLLSMLGAIAATLPIALIDGKISEAEGKTLVKQAKALVAALIAALGDAE